ncbi:MAG: WecB/TagA/CpsF family glycosyltransferase [Halanaerobiales bacterium]|nr:WecB/TagA/CpsF family glycosyltransferase [Halanaerobiales bacterium]
MDDLIDKLMEELETETKNLIFTPNSEIVVRAYDDSDYAKILNSADYLVPDGAGLLLAAKILGEPLQERVAGYDLMRGLLNKISDKNHSVYFLGGKPGIIDLAVKNVKEELPEINMAGFHHGYFDRNNKNKIIDEINRIRPDLLFVGMGVPLQEKFFAANFHNLNIKLGLAVGGSFDVLAGYTERAPLWMQKMYLEWFYRLLQEPKRISRMIALPRFLMLVFKEKFGI